LGCQADDSVEMREEFIEQAIDQRKLSTYVRDAETALIRHHRFSALMISSSLLLSPVFTDKFQRVLAHNSYASAEYKCYFSLGATHVDSPNLAGASWLTWLCEPGRLIPSLRRGERCPRLHLSRLLFSRLHLALAPVGPAAHSRSRTLPCIPTLVATYALIGWLCLIDCHLSLCSGGWDY
jgi:hypothetical protein